MVQEMGGGGWRERHHYAAAAAANKLYVVLFCLIRSVTSTAFGGYYAPVKRRINACINRHIDGIILINTKLNVVYLQLIDLNA